MAHRRYDWTEKKVQRFVKEGRGLGCGKEYKPWLTVADVSSRGRSHRVPWTTTGRSHQCLSDNEYFAFLSFCFEDAVVDIREQYPLNRKDTLEIATSLKLPHPRRGIPTVMTTDFVVTRKTPHGLLVDFAYAVKESKDLKKSKVQKTLKIERRYWENNEIEFDILESEKLKTVFNRNLAWIFDPTEGRDRPDLLKEQAIKTRVRDEFDRRPQLPIRIICQHIDTQLGLEVGGALRIVRKMLGKKEMLVDLNQTGLTELSSSQYSFCELAT
jgi:hypothetical protein